MISDEQKAMLEAPLNRSHVKQRTQAGRKLDYVEGWHAIAEANRIFGFDDWWRETVDMREIRAPEQIDGKWRVGYIAKVRVQALGVIREGTGYGSGIDKDVGNAIESAVKEAETDAMKRALMTFGNPFGLALYDKEQAAVVSDTAPQQQSQPAQAEPKKYTKEQSRKFYSDLEAAIRDTKTIEALKELWASWQDEIKLLPDDWLTSIQGEKEARKKALASAPSEPEVPMDRERFDLDRHLDQVAAEHQQAS